jgi:tRNA uridine 5-carboxymethylaminomethyl modification enzyme
MFTSRAEFRLSLRADNADQRLTPAGLGLGCVGETRRAAFEDKMERLAAGRALLSSRSWTSREAAAAGIRVSADGARRSTYDLLAFPDVTFDTVLAMDPAFAQVDNATRRQLERDALYANYIERQERDVEAMARDEAQAIPDDFDYTALAGLSNELRQKLTTARPSTLAQAGRVEGMTPAALTLMLARLRQARRKSA